LFYNRSVTFYTDENLFCKDDDTRVFIQTKNSIGIILKINKLSNEIFANQFIFSIDIVPVIFNTA